jgi:flagella basal body P-ring formation protein FlgA
MKTLMILAAAGSLAGPALAGQPVTLKADTVDADAVVTLSDIFDGAGPAGRLVLANRPGASSLILDAAAVQAAARRAGLDWANPDGLHKIVVHGGPVGSAALTAASAPRGNVEVLTYARSLSAGEIVQPADLVWVKLAAAPNDAPSDAEAVIGQAAKRPLRAGAPVSARDVGVAQIIKSGDIMTITYEADGISLALQGKAMSTGGVGETVSVQNTSSRKIFQALVTGPGQAVVGPAADAMKSARPARYAAR